MQPKQDSPIRPQSMTSPYLKYAMDYSMDYHYAGQASIIRRSMTGLMGWLKRHVKFTRTRSLQELFGY